MRWPCIPPWGADANLPSPLAVYSGKRPMVLAPGCRWQSRIRFGAAPLVKSMAAQIAQRQPLHAVAAAILAMISMSTAASGDKARRSATDQPAHRRSYLAIGARTRSHSLVHRYQH